jgi:hypothetical protein
LLDATNAFVLQLHSIEAGWSRKIARGQLSATLSARDRDVCSVILLDESTIPKGEGETICQNNISFEAVKKHGDSRGIDVVHSTSKYPSYFGGLV